MAVLGGCVDLNWSAVACRRSSLGWHWTTSAARRSLALILGPRRPSSLARLGAVRPADARERRARTERERECASERDRCRRSVASCRRRSHHGYPPPPPSARRPLRPRRVGSGRHWGSPLGGSARGRPTKAARPRRRACGGRCVSHDDHSETAAALVCRAAAAGPRWRWAPRPDLAGGRDDRQSRLFGLSPATFRSSFQLQNGPDNPKIARDRFLEGRSNFVRRVQLVASTYCRTAHVDLPRCGGFAARGSPTTPRDPNAAETCPAETRHGLLDPPSVPVPTQFSTAMGPRTSQPPPSGTPRGSWHARHDTPPAAAVPHHPHRPNAPRRPPLQISIPSLKMVRTLLALALMVSSAGAFMSAR